MNIKNGCVINLDFDFLWKELGNKEFDSNNLPFILDDLVREYKSENVSDIVLNCNAQGSVSPSKVFTYLGDKYERTVEFGLPVDYKEKPIVKVLYKLKQLNFDAYGYCVKKFREEGLTTWLSVRMNDCHYHHFDFSELRDDFFYEAKEKGWFVGEKEYGTYFGRGYNYAIPEVREKFLEYIEEQITRYDVDGLELDYTREILCFDFKKEPNCSTIMTEFIGRVKEIVKSAEKKYGHTIKIMLRTIRDMDDSKRHGVDTVELAKHGLIDVVVPSPRFITVDTGMEIDKWVNAMKPFGVSVYPALEAQHIEGIPNNTETVKAQTVQFTDMGADKIYLFNYFFHSPWIGKEECKEMYRLAGSVAESRKGVRRHIITFQDDMFGITENPWHPLPKGFVIKASLDVITGKISKNAKVKAFVGMRPYDMPLGGQLNGKDILPAKEGREDAFILKDKRWSKEEIRVFDVPNELLTDDVKYTFNFFSPSYGSITYFELKVEES